jgi:Family of unknown function (DUF5906)
MCLLVHGPEKSGKTQIFQRIGEIIGRKHFIICQDPQDWEGEFNSTCCTKIYVFNDETSWGGDKRAANKRKTQITGAQERVRQMYNDPLYRDSYTNWGEGTNEDWCIPAGPTCRRYLAEESMLEPLLNHPMYIQYLPNKNIPAIIVKVVFKLRKELGRQPTEDEIAVSLEETLTKKNDTIVQDGERARIDDYFTLLNQSLDKDEQKGLKCLANFLYNVPIDGYDSRSLPVTELLGKQKYLSLDSESKWWLDCLARGYLAYRTSATDESVWPENKQIELSEIFTTYKTETDKQVKKNKSEFESISSFWNKISRYMPSKVRLSTRTEKKMAVNSNGQRTFIGNQLMQTIILPSIDECRRSFSSKVPGIEYFWQNAETEPKPRMWDGTVSNDEQGNTTYNLVSEEDIDGFGWVSSFSFFIPNAANNKKKRHQRISLVTL